jgi:hypothetical protein
MLDAVPSSGPDDRSAPRAYILSRESPADGSTRQPCSRRLALVAVPPGGLIIPMIRRDPSGPDAIDDPFHLSRPDPSGPDQIDAEHQATDLAVAGESLAGRTSRPGAVSCRRTTGAHGLDQP